MRVCIFLSPLWHTNLSYINYYVGVSLRVTTQLSRWLHVFRKIKLIKFIFPSRWTIILSLRQSCCQSWSSFMPNLWSCAPWKDEWERRYIYIYIYLLSHSSFHGAHDHKFGMKDDHDWQQDCLKDKMIVHLLGKMNLINLIFRNTWSHLDNCVVTRRDTPT